MNNSKVLVAVENYPDLNGTLSLAYAHTRNKYYKQSGIDVSVLNFSCNEDYIIDDIKVLCYQSYQNSSDNYDILICHAANLRDHYRFLRRYGRRFKQFIFFFHGHEVLKVNKAYSKPYDYMKTSRVKCFLRDIYDDLKLMLWRNYYTKVAYKSQFVFVSQWMYDEFIKWTKINPKFMEKRTYITYNCVGTLYEKLRYDDSNPKEFDFITIRSNLDGSKYAIDIVNRLAIGTPNAKFLLIGKGKYFDVHQKAPNITWVDKHLCAEEIIEYLSNARYGLMPTRTDAQGVMMCEMAAYGIPVITSDIPVCHEVFDGFDNAFFIDNDTQDDLAMFVDLKNMSKKHERFFRKNTIEREIEVIEKAKE